MLFNPHSDLKDKHSFLSASKSSWVNYDDEKLERTYETALAAMKGSQFHDLACTLIKMKVKLARSQKTINMYVNDAIGFRMTPEQTLYYSDNSFGTADAIDFRKNPKTNKMRLMIFDLKTGVTPAPFRQLEVYVALFCLEYGVRPTEIEIELRIYQNDEVKIYVPELESIINIMDKLVRFDQRIDDMKREALL